ncbi:DSBA-like thioredoxin domain-containing protein [Elysia marginata]|uniref:DSBA-like thioredoxin domain-containing protein n=1 Tax=Elysia marginata TaxID=1093978 RepID=A0AAV4FB47_9GAST|nr:DSBA-like thioredoxin domain-containing protein [Elysia marginata]
MEHSVTQAGDTAPDLPSRKSTVHILIISDIVCPWCWIAMRSLENAMALLQEKFNFDVQFSPFLLRPNCPEEGVPNVDYGNGEHPRYYIDYSYFMHGISAFCPSMLDRPNFSCLQTQEELVDCG